MWSTFGWIQSKLRNRLLPENARKIVMSHMWLRLEQMHEEGKCDVLSVMYFYQHTVSVSLNAYYDMLSVLIN